jgi:hypothetical protein
MLHVPAQVRRGSPSALRDEEFDRVDQLGPLRSELASYRYLLLLRFAIFNIAAFALAAAAYAEGLVNQALEADTTGLTAGIMLIFVAGLIVCTIKIWRISTELNCVREFDPTRQSWAAQYLTEVQGRDAGSRAIAGAALRVKLGSRVAVVRQIAGSLVVLGLIGTVVGFVVSLSGVDPSKASDVSSISPMVAELIRGMSIALYTTLVGAVLNLWLMVNYHMLHGGATRLTTSVISLGEARAHA